LKTEDVCRQAGSIWQCETIGLYHQDATQFTHFNFIPFTEFSKFVNIQINLACAQLSTIP